MATGLDAFEVPVESSPPTPYPASARPPAVASYVLVALLGIVHAVRHFRRDLHLELEYKRFVQEGEWWRAVTGPLVQLSHRHFALNVFCVLNLGGLDERYSTGAVFVNAVLLQALSVAFLLMLYNAVSARGGRHLLLRSKASGFTAVCLGLAMWKGLEDDENSTFVGYVFGSDAVVPFVILALTHAIVPRASFLYHFTGMLSGFVLSTGVLDFARQAYWRLVVLSWLALPVLLSIHETTPWKVPLVADVDLTGITVAVGCRGALRHLSAHAGPSLAAVERQREEEDAAPPREGAEEDAPPV